MNAETLVGKSLYSVYSDYGGVRRYPQISVGASWGWAVYKYGVTWFLTYQHTIIAASSSENAWKNMSGLYYAAGANGR